MAKSKVTYKYRKFRYSNDCRTFVCYNESSQEIVLVTIGTIDKIGERATMVYKGGFDLVLPARNAIWSLTHGHVVIGVL